MEEKGVPGIRVTCDVIVHPSNFLLPRRLLQLDQFPNDVLCLLQVYKTLKSYKHIILSCHPFSFELSESDIFIVFGLVQYVKKW